jgi:ribosomal protein L4
VTGRCLLGLGAVDEPTRRACRNLPGLTLKQVRNVSAYDVAVAGRILVGADAVEALLERASRSGAGGEKES